MGVGGHAWGATSEVSGADSPETADQRTVQPQIEELAAAPLPISMGRPDRIIVNWGPVSGYDFAREELTSRLFVDMTMKGAMSNFGMGNITIEAALGHSGDEFDAALGFYFLVPWLRAGYEYNRLDSKVVPSISAQIALARGGLFKRGDELRIEYRPTREEVLVGFSFTRPFRRYRMTRPSTDHAKLPKGYIPKPIKQLRSEILPPDLERSLGRIEHSVLWLDRLLTPHLWPGRNFTKEAALLRDHIRQEGHSPRAEDAAYHQELRQAFTLAASGSAGVGEQLSVQAEALIYEEVLVPFNRLFGQNKDPFHIGGYAENARARFRTYLNSHPHFLRLAEDESRAQRTLAAEIFRRVLASINQVTKGARKRWRQAHLFWLKQSRLIWLPLNYGLRPEQYDSQAEFDRVVADLTGQEFGATNTVSYLVNEQFHVELKKMIRETEHYQVMLFHDIRGRYGDNVTDSVGWDVVVDGYLAAFRQIVADIDSGKRRQVPQYFIFLDENYYQINKSRQIISLLENLYDGEAPSLADSLIQARVTTALLQLREDIAASPSFASRPVETLRDLFKVHINVTHPYDPVFASDTTNRDHRKIGFRDVFENDPAAGVAIFAGQGIGEHYYGPGWDDRALLVRGVSLVQVKSAVRQLFLSQGYEWEEVPVYLSLQEYPDDHEQRCSQLQARGWTTPVLFSFNETGYGRKQASILKAVLYNLLPPGGVLLAPDSLWLSEYWAGMVLSAALRGGHVFVVAPATGHAPSSAVITMWLMRQNLDLMLTAQKYFAPDVAAAGGTFRVGFYASEVSVHDLAGRLETLLAGRERYPFLAKFFAFHPEVIERAQQLRERLSKERAECPERPAVDSEHVAWHAEHAPFMHLKAHFLASARAMDIVGRPEWAEVLEQYFTTRHEQLQGETNDGLSPEMLTNLIPVGGDEGNIQMLTVGSHNQDRRSMLLDGEVLAAVSGPSSWLAFLDFMFILSAAEWLDGPEQITQVFPGDGSINLVRKMYWILKDLI